MGRENSNGYEQFITKGRECVAAQLLSASPSVLEFETPIRPANMCCSASDHSCYVITRRLLHTGTLCTAHEQKKTGLCRRASKKARVQKRAGSINPPILLR